MLLVQTRQKISHIRGGSNGAKHECYNCHQKGHLPKKCPKLIDEEKHHVDVEFFNIQEAANEYGLDCGPHKEGQIFSMFPRVVSMRMMQSSMGRASPKLARLKSVRYAISTNS
jgi:hypothetical protein